MPYRTRRAVPSAALDERSAPVSTGALRRPIHVPRGVAYGEGDGDGAGVVNTGSGRVSGVIADRRAAAEGTDTGDGLAAGAGVGVGLGVGVGAGTVVEPRDVPAVGEELAVGEGEGLANRAPVADGLTLGDGTALGDGDGVVVDDVLGDDATFGDALGAVDMADTGDALGAAEVDLAVGLAIGFAVGDAVGEVDARGVGVADGVGEEDATDDGDTDGDSETDGDANGDRLGVLRKAGGDAVAAGVGDGSIERNESSRSRRIARRSVFSSSVRSIVVQRPFSQNVSVGPSVAADAGGAWAATGAGSSERPATSAMLNASNATTSAGNARLIIPLIRGGMGLSFP